MRRYKNKDWQAAYEHSRVRLSVFLNTNAHFVIAHEAQLMLKAHYRGPWKMLFAIFKRELHSAGLHYLWPKWEWIRTTIFRRPQNEAIAEFERVSAGGEEVDRIANKL